MPAPDPNNPTTSQGPFSQYHDPVKGIQHTQLEQRPSGFMGTTGKLAMFGSQLLKGLAAGKMQKYARTEQQKYEQFEQKSRQVQAIQADPDIPNEVKAKAALLLQQSWGTLTKEQLGELKKLHGKEEGPAAHIRGLLGSVVDKLSGETPAQHTLGGSKDTKQPFDELNNLLADVHTGGEKYSNKAITSKLTNDISEAVKPYQANYDFRGAALDPKVSSLMQKLYQIDPNQGKLVSQRLQQGLTPPTSQEINADLERSILKDQPAAATDRGQPAMQPMPGVIGMEIPADTPILDKRAGAGSPPVSADQSGVKQFEPFKMPDGTVITSPAKEQAWLSLRGGTPQKAYFKRTVDGPNGTKVTERREAWVYPKEPGYIKDALTGEKLDGTNWQPTTAADHDAAAKVDKGRWIKKSVGGRDVQVHYDENGRKMPGSEVIDLGPTKVPKGPKPPDPLSQENKELTLLQKRQLLQAEEDKNTDSKQKRDVKSLTDKIMRQVNKDAAANNTTPDKILDQRISDFAVWYKDDPRLEGNFDAIQEMLRKRKSEAVTMSSKEALAANRQKAAQESGALQAPQQSAPVQQTPQPQKQAAPAAPQQGGQISVTDPKGGVHLFPNQAAADRFKQLAGIK